MRHKVFYSLLSIILFPSLAFSQDLTLIAESCSDECPSTQSNEIFKQFGEVFEGVFEDSQSGTVNAHQEAGWVVQTRELQDDGCYIYCTSIYKVAASDNCFYAEGDFEICYADLSQKPEEDKNTRVVASFHTHPIRKVDIEKLLDMDLLKASTEGPNIELGTYEFEGIDVIEKTVDFFNEPNEFDRIHTVEHGVPTIVISGLEGEVRAAVGGHTNYTQNSDGSIDWGEVVEEPANLSWECEACVEINPVNDCLEEGETIAMTATVRGPEDKSVTWEAEMGIIDDEGNYTAPSQPTTDQIIATSNADPSAADTISLQVGNCNGFWKIEISGDYQFSDSAENIYNLPAIAGFQIDFSNPENPNVKGIIRPNPTISEGFTGTVDGVFWFTTCGADLNDVLPCDFTTKYPALQPATLTIEINNGKILKGTMTASWEEYIQDTYPPKTYMYQATMEFTSIQKNLLGNE